jgi:N-acetylglucosaminyldiphosphoundecaprenol N-acetyl-beta-D-mannosaminyltransferase
MNGDRFTVLGVRIDDLDDAALDKKIEGMLSSTVPQLVVTPNPEFVLQAQEDPAFLRLLEVSHLSLPDGVGLRYGVSALTGQRLMHRHAGVDVLVRLAALCQKRGDRLALVGGLAGSAIKTADRLRQQFPGLEVLGINPGEVVGDSERVLVPIDLTSLLNTFAPTVLAVGLGQGKQERTILTLFKQVPSVRIGIGVGGSFDTLSGRFARAPLFFRASGLEWVWRLCLQPSRWKRMFRATVVFPLRVAKTAYNQGRFFSACLDVFPEIIHQLSRK